MNRALAVATFVFALACKTSPPIATTSPEAASPIVVVEAGVVDAGAKTLGPAERHAYAVAIGEGRKATIAKKYADADAAFGRALAIIADDARAFSERGYARHLAGRHVDAKADFQHALQVLDAKDKKLAAQIEFNLGLVETALDHAGVAAGHFHTSYDLNPTSAAKSRMTGCPVTITVPTVAIFPSIVDARAHYGDVAELIGSVGVFFHDGNNDDHSAVLVPIEGSKLAAVEVGLLGVWHCGTMGEADATRVGSAWKITYQAHRAAMSQGLCACEDGVACSPAGEPNAEKDPTCKCDSPICPLVCGGADEQEGRHLEIYVDAKTGAAIGQFEVDHEHLDGLTLHADLATKTLTATGGGCAQ